MIIERISSLLSAKPIKTGALLFLSLAIALMLGRWLAIAETPLTRHAVGLGLLANGAPDQAAHLFEAPLWQGVALYRAERYHRSVGAFVTDNSVTGLYNLGNAYARLGLYQGAVTAYEAVLKRQPTHEDASFNLELVRAAKRRADELELESRETENAGNWEDGLREEDKERSARQQAGEQDGEESQAPKPEDDGMGEQDADGGAGEPLTSDVEITGQGMGGSEQDNEMADAQTFSLSGREDEEADDLQANEAKPDSSEVLGGVTERLREEAIADQILLRRIEDDPALVLKARLNMALRRQRAK